MTSVSRVLVFFLFFALGFFPQKAFAADESGIGITIHPYLSDIIIQNEERVPFTVELSNNSGESREFSILAIDFGGLESSAGVAFLGSDQDIEKEFDPADWIELQVETIRIAAKESATLSGTIINTGALSPGGHYGALLFQEKKPVENVGPTNVNIDERIAALVFIRKEGGAVYEMNLRPVSVERPLIGLPETLTLSFRNAGNVHIVPRGRIDIKDPFGRLIAKGTVNENSSLLLPKSEKAYPIRFLPANRAYFPGKYTIEINIRYDGKKAFESQKMAYFIVPISFVCIGGGVILCIFLFVIWRKSRPVQS